MARIPRISTRIRADVLRTRRSDFSGVAASAAEPFDVLSDGFSDISDDFFSIAKALSRNKPKGDDTATDDAGNDGSASAKQSTGGGSGGGRERAVNAPDVAFTRGGGGIGHAASAVSDRNQSAFERLAGPALGAKAPTEESLLNGVRMITNTVKQTQAQHMLNAYGPVLDQALTGFRGLTGLEAITAWGKTREDMRKTAVNFLSTITDEDVRRMAEPPIMRAVEEKVAEADLHVLSAQQGFTDEVFDRTQASLRKSVVEDPGRAPERAEEAAASTFEHVLARTGDETAAEHAAQLARTRINAQAISVLTDRGQLAEARAYFEAVKDRVDPDNTAHLERLLEEGELREEADRATDDILALDRPEEEALLIASGLPDGPHRDMVMRRIGGHHRQRRALEQQEFRERFNALEKKVQNGGELIPSEVIDLPGDARHYLETKREQAQLKAINPEYQPVGDDGNTWAEFHDFAQDDDALSELSLEELKQQFGTGVTEAQWDDTILQKWKMARIATGRDVPSDGDPMLSDMRRVDQHAAQAGIDARNMPGPYGQFVAEYNQRVASENAVTAQAKRLILEDMVVDRLELGAQLTEPTADRVFELKKSDVGHAGRPDGNRFVQAGHELRGTDAFVEEQAEERRIAAQPTFSENVAQFREDVVGDVTERLIPKGKRSMHESRLAILAHKKFQGGGLSKTKEKEFQDLLQMLRNPEPEMKTMLGKVAGAGAEFVGDMYEGLGETTSAGMAIAMTASGAVLVAGNAGPQALIPEELLTVPGAFFGGFGIGFTLANAERTRKIQTGKAYLAAHEFLEKEGITPDPDKVRLVTNSVGLVNGLLEGIGLSAASGPVKETALKLLSSGGGKAMLDNPAVREVLVELVSEQAGSSAEDVSKKVVSNLTSVLAQQMVASSHDASGQPLTLESATTAVTDAVKEFPKMFARGFVKKGAGLGGKRALDHIVDSVGPAIERTGGAGVGRRRAGSQTTDE